MIRFGLILFLIAFSLPAFAQIVNLPDNSGAPIREQKYQNVEGSPYLFEAWINGDLQLADGSVRKNIPIKYNTYQQQVEVVSDGQTIAVYPSSLKEFTINSLDENGNKVSYKFRNGFKVPPYKKDDFFQVLYDGEMKLLGRVKTQLVEPITSSSYGATNKASTFESGKEYFVLKKNGEAEKIRLRKKDIRNLFPEKKDLIKKIIREEDIDLDTEEGVTILFSNLDSKL